MSGTKAWVLGGGGLLGSSLRRFLGSGAWPSASYDWRNPERLLVQFRREASAFFEEVRRTRGCWSLLWCAGVGAPGSPPELLESEAQAFRCLLAVLDAEAPELPGSFFLASSAGGVFAGSRVFPLTETSPLAPLTPYGRLKLDQERQLERWISTRRTVSALIGRLSNLYGPSPIGSARRNLISELCRSLLLREPAGIYVPLDTLRDYLHADDAARRILHCMKRLEAGPPGSLVTKLLCSGQPASVARVVGLLEQITGTRPYLTLPRRAEAAGQPPRLLFQSRVWSDPDWPLPRPLEAGIAEVYEHQLRRLQEGRPARRPCFA